MGVRIVGMGRCDAMKRGALFGVVSCLTVALCLPAGSVLAEEQPADSGKISEFEVDPDTLRAVTHWPRELSGPQVVVVEVKGPAALSGNVWIGRGFRRMFGGKEQARWERSLMPQTTEQGGGMWQNVRVWVTRDRRLWNGSNLNQMPKGKMSCRIFVNGELIVEHSAPYRWNDVVNTAVCEIRSTRYTR